MYIAIWQSISAAPNRDMTVHMDAIGTDGPAFLWYLFKYYHGTAVQTIRMTLAKMNNLHTAIELQCKMNINKFATYVTALLLNFPKTEAAMPQHSTRFTKS